MYDLVNKGILHRVGRGTYSFSGSEKREFVPFINAQLQKLWQTIKEQFPYIDMCLWSTKWLNEFMLHQPFKFYTIVEVEKEVMEAVFYNLREQGYEVFLDPSDDVINNYVVGSEDPIIITGLTTEAPTQKIEGVWTQTLEKLLVDIYCDPSLFAAQQGAELARVYQTAFEKYAISKTKMLRYANRRNKREPIEDFITNHTKIWQ
ncbi:hypothetical protein KO566_02885 [Flavobacteriaceae bacterium XHP0103]|nr:hypothetical protein [Marixanthotalea marina]